MMFGCCEVEEDDAVVLSWDVDDFFVCDEPDDFDVDVRFLFDLALCCVLDALAKMYSASWDDPVSVIVFFVSFGEKKCSLMLDEDRCGDAWLLFFHRSNDLLRV